MKQIHVDLNRCEGHGRCYAIAPDLLQPFDDHGHADFFGPPIDAAERKVFDLADRAIQSCPEQALSWADSQSGRADADAPTPPEQGDR